MCKRHSKIRKELMLRKKSHSAQGLRFQTLQAVQKSRSHAGEKSPDVVCLFHPDIDLPGRSTPQFVEGQTHFCPVCAFKIRRKRG